MRIRVVGSINIINEAKKLKYNLDKLNSHTGEIIFGASWINIILKILSTKQCKNDLIKEEIGQKGEGVLVIYRLRKIAEAHPELAKFIFEDPILRHKLLSDHALNSYTLRLIADSHLDTATYIFKDTQLKSLLLEGRMHTDLIDYIKRNKSAYDSAEYSDSYSM